MDSNSCSFGEIQIARHGHDTMLSLVVGSWLRAVSFSLCATLAEAKYPFSSGPKATLADDTSVSFDPLGVAAVLGNPRADASAAKLYVQYDWDIFHWPHTSMIGGTLPAMQMLVEYFTSGFPSNHPSPPIKMCAKAVTMIPVRSNFVFRELPLDFSNVWLNHLLAFKSGGVNPGNDFMVIYIDAVPKSAEDIDQITRDNRTHLENDPGPGWWMAGRLTLYFLDLVNGTMILASMLIGILAADIWAFTLFFFYGSYWISSALITFLPMVQVSTPRIVEDKSPRYAAYERLEGGTIIFKGRKDNMEAWTRTTWKYEPTWVQTTLHWLWMTTGSLAPFLAVLVYATVAEIAATKISRLLQIKAKEDVQYELLTDNNKRTEGIIAATISVQRVCRPEGFNWIEMGLLPNMPACIQMQGALAEIDALQNRVEESDIPFEEGAVQAEMEKCYKRYLERAREETGKAWEKAENDKRSATKLDACQETEKLASRLVGEMRTAANKWIQRVPQKISKLQ